MFSDSRRLEREAWLKMRSLLCFCFLIMAVASASAQIKWHKDHSNPVLPHWSGDPDQPSSYKYILGPSVIYDDAANLFHMWFSSMAYGWGTNFCISEAISPDGLRWYTNIRNPVIHPTAGTFDSRSIYSPMVVRVDTGYRMYYAGYNENRFEIGLATSPDGIHWTKHPANPVLRGGPPGSWNHDVRQIAVLFDGKQYRALFDGRSSGGVWGIGLATSPDGIAWTPYEQNPILTAGPPGSFEEAGVGEPCMVLAANTYHLIYTGYAKPGLTGRLGYAYSTDCINWTKFDGNPVLDHGTVGTWDAGHLAAGSLMLQNSTLHLWYVGGNNPTTAYEIGHATSPLMEDTEDAPASVSTHLSGFALLATCPNPFDSATTLMYSLPEQCSISLRLYSVLGREVRFLRRGTEGPGIRATRWNGRSDAGASAGSGLYFSVLTAIGASGKHYSTSAKVVRAQ